VIDEWVKTNETKGLAAKKLLAFIAERAQQYAQMTPEQMMRLTIEKPVDKFIVR